MSAPVWQCMFYKDQYKVENLWHFGTLGIIVFSTDFFPKNMEGIACLPKGHKHLDIIIEK